MLLQEILTQLRRTLDGDLYTMNPFVPPASRAKEDYIYLSGSLLAAVIVGSGFI